MKILLFSPTTPNKKSSGAIMLYDLCSLIKQDQIYCFVAKDPLREIPISRCPSIVKYKIVNRPFELAIRFPNWFFDKTVSRLIENIKDFYIQKRIIKKAIEFGKQNQVDCVWGILQGKTMIVSALKIAKGLGVPLLTQIWDEPEWILSNTNLDQQTKEEVLKEFDRAIKSSIICAAASSPMSEDYHKKYRVKTAVFLGSLDKKMAHPSAQKLNSGKEFKVGFAGQMYAFREWEALINVLEKVNWKIKDKDVKIYLLGKFNPLRIWLKAKGRIRALGYKSQKDTLKILSKMDILYCPYWFDKEYEKVARSSFPSKLTIYLASGRPVIFHGPRYASPAKFIEKNHCGILCDSLKAKDILSNLNYIAEDAPKYARLAKSGRTAFDKYLTFKNLGVELDNFLNEARKVNK